MYGLTNENSKKYCYAWKDLSFGGYQARCCPVCGRNTSTELPSSEIPALILEGGKQYPDFLYYASCGLYFLVSERALSAFRQYGVTGYDRVTEVLLYRNGKGGLKVLDDICYYSLNIFGTVDFDLKVMALKRKHLCASCGQFEWSRQRLSIINTVLDINTWDGCDLCRVDSFPGHVVCTEKVRTAAEEYRLTGVIFRNEGELFRIPS